MHVFKNISQVGSIKIHFHLLAIISHPNGFLFFCRVLSILVQPSRIFLRFLIKIVQFQFQFQIASIMIHFHLLVFISQSNGFLLFVEYGSDRIVFLCDL